MAKNVLILMGSPRKNGNTSILCDEFKRGAEEAGNTVEKINVAGLKINGCLGCNGCQRNGGTCVQKDDMTDIYGKILAADVVVLGSPVYYYTWTAQLKAVLDRTYSLLGTMKDKDFYMISTCMSPDETWCKMMLDSFHNYVICFDDSVREAGYVFGFNAGAPGDVKGTDAMQKAYELGKAV